MDLRPPQVVLSFGASMISKNKEDLLREFTISYFVNEKCFSVFENVVPNSGFPGGKFLQKVKAINAETEKPYEPKDIYISADLNLGGWRFHLTSATEGTLRAMEARTDAFVKSDLSGILESVVSKLSKKKAALQAALEGKDRKHHGTVSQNDLMGILRDFGIELNEQQFLTLFRKYRFADSERFEYSEFLSLMK